MNLVGAKNAVLGYLLGNQRSILAALNARKTDLQTHEWIRANIGSVDVSADMPFQRAFTRFYKVRGVTTQWRNHYFSLMESVKNSPPAYSSAMNALQKFSAQKVHASFGSKLLATLQPDQPVYDSKVRRRIHNVAPGFLTPRPRQGSTVAQRYQIAVAVHQELNLLYAAVLADPQWKSIEVAFDRCVGAALPQAANFHPIKKLDLMLWA